MTRWLLVIALVLLAAPTLLACEDCISKGERDPYGGGP